MIGDYGDHGKENREIYGENSGGVECKCFLLFIML